ncbi:MAG: hypothetical protein ACI9M6_000330 [Hydrogenophaga sp.]|jgi:hypothetical protein
MARTFERQVVELHVRVALLNRFTQLGRPTTVPVVAMASLRLGLGSSRCAFDLRNKAQSNSKSTLRWSERSELALRFSHSLPAASSGQSTLSPLQKRVRCVQPIATDSASLTHRKLA